MSEEAESIFLGKFRANWSSSAPEDPSIPPLLPLETLGRAETAQALFVELFVDRPRDAVTALQSFWPEYARELSQEIGLAILREDPALRRRWPALSPATLRRRRQQGIMSDFPYLPIVGQEWYSNRWGTETETQGTTVTAGVGWRRELDDQAEGRRPHRQRADLQYGTSPSRRVGRNRRVMIPPRPLGLTQEIRDRLSISLRRWLESNANRFMDKGTDAEFLPQFQERMQRPIFLESLSEGTTTAAFAALE